MATPHVNSRDPNDAATIAELVGELNARLATEGIDLNVLPGAEIAITPSAELEPAQLPRLGLGGGPWLLVEPPFTPDGDRPRGAGARPARREVIASCSRTRSAARRSIAIRQICDSLVRGGVLTSITAGSLVGRFGGEVRRFALELVARGAGPQRGLRRPRPVDRPPGMASGARAGGARPLADWLTRAVPAAILSGEAIPPPPVGRPSTRDRRPRRGGGAAPLTAQASFVIATTIPISTNTTIATCIQIQVGDIAPTA